MHIDTRRFQFIADALHGQGGFRPRSDGTTLVGPSYLIQYPREGDAKFARRNQVAWYANDLASACARFAGYLSSRRPQRDTLGNPLFDAFVDDADWQGNALDVFWSRFTVEAKARGAMLLLVDMPREIGTTRAEQMDSRAMPYIAMIEPERIERIEVDDSGMVAMVEIDDGVTDDGTPMVRGWDTERWWVRVGEQITESNEHPLGVCPVLAFGESAFPAEGEFAQIADLSRRLFNLRSELDEILRAQTFSLLTYQVPADQAHTFDASAISGQIGTHNMLVHSGQTPAFIAPPDGPARIYLDVIAQVEEKIRRIGHVVEAPDRAESGVALAIRFQQLNSSLVHWASRMEDLERRVWWLVSLWLGLQEPPSISWDDDYAITDLAAELDVLAAMIGSGFSPETLRAKRQQIISLDFASMDEPELDALMAAEAEAGQERTIGGMPQADDAE